MMRGEIGIRISEKALGGLLAATDWEALRQRTLALLAGTGIGDFLIRIEVHAGDGASCTHCFGSLPAAMMRECGDHFREEGDLVNRHIACSSLPLEWNAERLCGIGGGQPYAALLARGIREGISVAARDALASSRVDFYRHAPAGPGPATVSTADLMLLGSYLHDAVRDLWKRQPDEPPTLTRREQACLYWSAAGKTGKETAMILSISHHTVYFHLKNAARKFNVYSTRHAISRATRLGMIKQLASAHD